jgi:hypothetical protein
MFPQGSRAPLFAKGAEGEQLSAAPFEVTHWMPLPDYPKAGSVAPPEAERRCQICGGTEEDHRKAVQKCSITHAFSPKAERQQEEEK